MKPATYRSKTKFGWFGQREVEGTPVRFSKLVFMARNAKPGALEILQDALEDAYPDWFEKAKRTAKRIGDQTDKEWVVVFTPKRNAYPFGEYPLSMSGSLSYYGHTKGMAVWSSKTGNRIDPHIMRRTGGVRRDKRRRLQRRRRYR